MSAITGSFYVTGGTLRQDAPSYIERRADRDLYEGLLRGEFCYVLHARQMGKSSLMAHTTARLRETGVTVVNLDLTRLGQNLTVEQWYDGLLGHLGRQLDREDELEEYWATHERQSPLQRWLGALEEIVLRRCPGRLVVAIDEIDAVRSLPFSTDEFFAAIRDCYNRRSHDPEFARLAFCLLGVATPSDLIQNSRTTPFNIGARIELTDFTEKEAAPLAQGLGRDPTTGAVLLNRVLYWTGGHPYLTQRLCQFVAADPAVTDPAGVDRHCEALFLSPQAREQDDNLLFIRERLVSSEGDRASLLDLYDRVRGGKPVRLDDTNQLVSLLRLSGITRVAEGRLEVRNRIYERVFDQAWIAQHMPDAELRRQRAAYRRGLLRATAVSTAILVVVAGLALAAVTQAHRANQQRRVADQQRQVAEAQRQEARRNLYVGQMNLAQRLWEEGRAGRVTELLAAWRPPPGQEDLRGFEWRYLWRLCRQEDAQATLRGHTDLIWDLAASPDGRLLASTGWDNHLKLWDRRSRRELATLEGGNSNGVALSPDGRIVASGSVEHTVKLWDTSTFRLIVALHGKGDVTRVAFSPDGKTLAAGTGGGAVDLWELAGSPPKMQGRLTAALRGPTQVCSLAFSHDGRSLAAGYWDGAVRLWDPAARRLISTLLGHTIRVWSVAFSPDGRLLASGSFDGSVRLWDLASKRTVAILGGEHGPILGVAFSPDGKLLATGNTAATQLWEIATRREVTDLSKAVGCYPIFSPDGHTLATALNDYTIRLWNLTPKRKMESFRPDARGATALALSPDGRTLAWGSSRGRVTLWAAEPGWGDRPPSATSRQLTPLTGHKTDVGALVFSPDGRALVSASWDDNQLKLWDLRTKRVIASWDRRSGPFGPPAFSPDGRILAVDRGRKVSLWDRLLRRQLGALPKDTPDAGTVVFSPDGALLAVPAAEGMVKLWELGSRRVVGSVVGSPPLVFSPDGKLLAVRSSLFEVKLWSVPACLPVTTLKGNRTSLITWTFSPDGKTLAVGSYDNTIHLWALPTGQEVAILKGHTAPVRDVLFSPDGDTLISASEDRTIRFWRASSFPEADRVRVVGISGSDREVRLQWEPAPHAMGYNVYQEATVGRAEPNTDDRTPINDRRTGSVKRTAQPLTGTFFVDRGRRLVNGRAAAYAVAALFRGPRGQAMEGPPTRVQATPVAGPPGFRGCSIDEGERTGSLLPATTSGMFTLLGSGQDIWGETDGCYFLNRSITGDFQAIVRMLTRPKETDDWAQAGLMVRESLDPGARHTALLLTAAQGLHFKWRVAQNDATAARTALENRALKLPITLRLSRRGDTVTPEYSEDGGQSFRPASSPYQFQPPLAKNLYAGVAISAHDPNQVTEAKFSGLEIRSR